MPPMPVSPASPATPTLQDRSQQNSSQNTSYNEAQDDTSDEYVSEEDPDASNQVLDALRELGFDSLAPVLHSLLESNSLSDEDRRQMLLTLMRYKKDRETFAVDPEVCDEVREYALQVATKEMDGLVMESSLRLPVSRVNPETLERFDIGTIAKKQQAIAPLVTSILYTCAGVKAQTEPDVGNEDHNGPEDVDLELGDDISRSAELPRGRNRQQIATVSLCMLSYARNQQSNLLQVTTGYYAYADNTTKRMIEILHRMGFMVTYETVRQALSINAKAILEEIKEKAWRQRFFLSFDNMNFYEHRRDERLHNKNVQINYTAGYICFMHSDQDGNEANWDDCYLKANQIDYDAVNHLTGVDFALGDDDFAHHASAARYTISNILDEYFPNSIRAQKIGNPHGLGLIPKYMKWPSPLSQMQCPMGKANLIPLPTLPLDESSIKGTIDILKAYIKILGLENHVVQDKCIMFKGDFLTVRNMRRAIYRRQQEPIAINRFGFIEPIAGLFHLQMNVLKLFLGALWGKKDDRISLARFQSGLGRQKATRDAKDFHACDDFFRTVIKSYAITLCMHETKCADVATFKSWLSRNDWRKMIQDAENTHLGAFKFTEIQAAAAQLLRERVSTSIVQEKEDWRRKRAQDRNAGIITTYMVEPDWEKKFQERVKAGAAAEHDIVRENALRFLNLGLVYLDFVDACRKGYSGRVEKCIQCFAVVFQGSTARNYAGECLHLVACLKKVWKPEFKSAWLDYCLINPSGRSGKFYPDDRFGETIIKLNKEKVRPSANAKTDRFLREVVAPNVLTLWKSKEVMADATGATDHGNRHAVVETYYDVMFIVDLLLLEGVFEEKPGRGSGDNPESTHIDLFGKGMSAIALGVPLQNYIERARGNWRNAEVASVDEEEGQQPFFGDNTNDLAEYTGSPNED